MAITEHTADIKVGIVGLGLMGSSIATCWLISGHSVVAIAPVPDDFKGARQRISSHLNQCEKLDLLKSDIDSYLKKIDISQDYRDLRGCHFVLECVVEDNRIKAQVLQAIEGVVDEETIIGSNTSAIPISELQNHLRIPVRFLGVHWSEPAYASRFLEIINGKKTDMRYAERAIKLAQFWDKEPTYLRKDIRGFITNRLAYAVFREAFALWNEEKIPMQDLDKAFRNDVGSWMAAMGIFQRMDFEGLQRYLRLTKALFPLLSNSHQVPEIMQEIVQGKGRGVHDRNGLYQYSEEESNAIKESYAKYCQEMYLLVSWHLENKRKNRNNFLNDAE